MNTTDLHLWTFKDGSDVTARLATEFENHHPAVHVEIHYLTAPRYAEEYDRFWEEGAPADVTYLGDEDLGDFVRRGMIRPLPGTEEIENLAGTVFDYCRRSLHYEDELYGLPVYAGMEVFLQRDRNARRVAEPVEAFAWESLREDRVDRVSSGRSGSPVLLPLGKHPKWFFSWWAARSAVTPPGGEWRAASEDRAVVELLQWLTKALHEWRLLRPDSTRRSHKTAYRLMLEGGPEMASIWHYEMKALNGQAAHNGRSVKMLLYPGIQQPGTGTVGWTRMHAVSSRTENPELAASLVHQLSTPEAHRRRHFATGVGFAYPDLWRDPGVVAQTGQWCDTELGLRQQAVARERPELPAKWWREWEQYHQKEIHRALNRLCEPEEALHNSALEAEKLAAE